MRKGTVNHISHTYSHIYDKTSHEIPARSWEKSIEHHYFLWGNTNDPYKIGTTKILTKNGYKPASNRINKIFLEMVNQSDILTFSK